MIEDEKRLIVITTSYFKNSFESLNLEKIDKTLADVTKSITDLINANLTIPVTEQKVKLTLFAMH